MYRAGSALRCSPAWLMAQVVDWGSVRYANERGVACSFLGGA